VLRAVEMDRNPQTAPRPKRHLREHVRDVAFSASSLSALIEKHELYPALYRANPIAALTSFREDIELEVYQNFFIEERSPLDPPRSARIAVTYRSSDRAQGLAVTRDLGKLIVEHEVATRRRQAMAATNEADDALKRARGELVELRRQIAKRAMLLGVDLQSPEMRAALLHATVPPQKPEAGAAPGLLTEPPVVPDFASQLTGNQATAQAHVLVELLGLKRSLAGVERRLAEAEHRKAELELGEKLERGALGMRFEVIDEGAIAVSAGIGADDLVLVGLITLLFGLPLMVFGVGAFDPKIHNSSDIARLGLHPLGVLSPAFVGSRGEA
jgi:hypothetical protein